MGAFLRQLPAGVIFFSPAIFIFILLLSSAAADRSKLNVPRVLLPRATAVVTNFTLKVTNGDADQCCVWTSTRSDVVTVSPVNSDGQTINECSPSAVVSAVSSSNARLTSIIWAEHPSDRFRCDVIVDKIHSLEIITTTQQLFLGDNPEAFEIRAKDDKGDTFTSLEGLEFDWRIENDKTRNDSVFVDAHNILRLNKFADTNYKPPSSVSALESIGKRGYMVLVEGINTGSGMVTAALRSPMFKDVERASVRLLVVANLILEPAHDMYVLLKGQIHYRVYQIKQSHSSEIPMPSQQYQLQMHKDDVCDLDEKSSVVTCNKLGTTQVVLRNGNIGDAEADNVASTIHVVRAAYINLVVLPSRNWILQRSRHYVINAELYDSESHQIYPSANLVVQVVFAKAFFEILASSANGTTTDVRAVRTGRTEITAKLIGIKDRWGSQTTFPTPISKTQTVTIHDPVTVHPKLMLFPFDPVSPSTYQVPMMAEGGSGEFTWGSSEAGVASVERLTGVVAGGAKEGSSTVTVYDVKNPAHTDSANVYVVPAVDLVVLPSLREAEVGSVLEIPVGLRGRVPGIPQPVPFTDCRHLQLNVTVADQSVFAVVPGHTKSRVSHKGSCISVQLRAAKADFTTVVISYSTLSGTTSSVQITVAGFDSLEATEPDQEIVLTVGSSKVFQFKGGPLPWIHEHSSHKISLAENNLGIVRNETMRLSDSTTKLQVSCVRLGEDTLTLQVGNTPSKTLPVPAHSTLIGQISCAEPARIELRIAGHSATPDSDTLPPCPWPKHSTEPFPVLRGSDAVIEVNVFDQLDRKFDNFSSLEFHWDVSDGKLVDVKEEHGIVFPWRHKRRMPVGQKTVFVHDKKGRASVTATVDRYRREALHTVKSPQHVHLTKSLTARLDVVLVGPAVFQQESVRVLNHPANRQVVAILDGSGFVHFAASSPQSVELLHDPKMRTLTITPVLDGDLVVEATDLCLAAKPTILRVVVAGLERIDVSVANKVEIGKTIPLSVQAFDSAGQPVPVKYYAMLSLNPAGLTDLVSLTLRDEAASVKPTDTQRFYAVHGNSIGRLTVVFRGVASDGQQWVSSSPVEIQVFPPLHLEPRNLTLVETAKYQLETEGGPQPQSKIVFSIRSKKVASVDPSGTVDAVATGNSIISAQIIDVDPVTGKDVVYAQDEVQVYVVAFSGVRIRVPLPTVEIGRELPLLAMGGSEQEIPFSFATTNPLYTFSWSVDNTEVADLSSPFHPLELALVPENNFAIRLLAKSVGVVTVRVTVVTNRGKQFSDSVVVKVVEVFSLLNPACSCEGILMAPHSRGKLRTTKDGRVQYRVLEGQGEAQLQVDRYGDMSSGGQLGWGVLVVESQESDSARILSRSVEVKETSFLKINVVSDLRSDGSLSGLPLGTSIRLSVTLHDNLARDFFATNSQLRFRASRNDVVSWAWSGSAEAGRDNSTLVVKALKTGSTVLKVWDADRPNLYDFLEIRVVPVILPHGTQIHVGQVICYKCGLLSSDGRKGFWMSSSPSLHINKDTGVALAVNPGSALVYYNVSATVAARADVSVVALETVDIIPSPSEQRFVTNAPNAPALTIPVSLGSMESRCSESQLSKIAEEVHRLWDLERDLFSCHVEFSVKHPAGIVASDVFSAFSDVDKSTGLFVCVIQAKSSGHHLEEALSSFESALTLIVRPSSGVSGSGTAGEPQVLSIEFIPAFVVHTTQLHLNHVQMEAPIVISSSPQMQKTLQIRTPDVGIVEVGSPVLDRQTPHWQYPIKLLTGPSLPIRLQSVSTSPHIIVESIRTGQTVQIPVRIRYTADLSQSRVGFPWNIAGGMGDGDGLWSYVVPTVVIGGLLGFLYMLWRFYQQGVQDRQYYQYLAATGQPPPQPFPRGSPNTSSRTPSSGCPRFSPTKPHYPGVDWRQASVWKSEEPSGDGVYASREDPVSTQLWSTNRALPTTTNTLFRRSPNST